MNFIRSMRKAIARICLIAVILSGCTTAKNCTDFIGFIRNNNSRNTYINLTCNQFFAQDTISIRIGNNVILDHEVLTTKKNTFGSQPSLEYLITIKKQKIVAVYNKTYNQKVNLVTHKTTLEGGYLGITTIFNSVVQSFTICADSTTKIWINHHCDEDTLRLVCQKSILYYD